MLLKVLGTILGSLILGAVGDGLNFKGKKRLGHLFRSLEIGLLLSSSLYLHLDVNQYIYYILGYVLARMAIFDPLFNKFAGLALSYLGVTSLYNRVLKAFKAPAHGVWFARVIFLIGSLGIIFKKFKKK